MTFSKISVRSSHDHTLGHQCRARIAAQRRRRPLIVLVGLCTLLTCAQATASCGSAFCSVNTNWTTESALIGAGSVLDLRFEYLDQDHLRSGTHSAEVGESEEDHEELETINRNYLLTFSHSFNSPWGLWLIAPLVNRDHRHIHVGESEHDLESWSFTDLGDVSLLGRFRLPFSGSVDRPVTSGINFGVKFPTGRTHVSNEEGETAERSLQPGSGTTDAVVGVYFQKRYPARGDIWFSQILYQHALDSHEGYKPGPRFALDFGYNHALGQHFGAVIQLNLLIRGRDKGQEAEPDDSGGTYIFVSPGLNYAFNARWQAYAYVQFPLYQHVNGVQLTADWSVVAGASRRF